ncbi:MAG: iron-sulfur cluster assembly protein, partial [Proteobacteria bacterium]|nr:iron-sulfur cluster assembly protein [Pseudomonadota bacterium]
MMVTKNQIEDMLEEIFVPQVGRSLTEMNVLRDVDIEDSTV